MNTTQLATALISYILGFLSGFVASYYFKKKFTESSSKTAVLVIVSVMWTLSVAFEIVSPEYKTSPMVHGLMGSIVGFFYKFEAKK